jgi:hypothetical protein
LHGYAVAPDTPGVPLTDGYLVLSRSGAPKVWSPGEAGSERE